jgi:hypothetical protein
MIDLTTFKPVGAGSAVIEYAGDRLVPPYSTLALSTSNPTAGQALTDSHGDPPGAASGVQPDKLRKLTGEGPLERRGDEVGGPCGVAGCSSLVASVPPHRRRGTNISIGRRPVAAGQPAHGFDVGIGTVSGKRMRPRMRHQPMLRRVKDTADDRRISRRRVSPEA